MSAKVNHGLRETLWRLFLHGPTLAAVKHAMERADHYIEKGMPDRSGPVLRELRDAMKLLES